jgi:ABC-type microcin C transport system duplicated ATPase subunit YejF
VVRAVSDEILVMRAGRVVEQGPTALIFEQPERHTHAR